MALGAFDATPLEVAGAYTAFPGGGTARRPYLLAGVDTADGERVVTPVRTSERIASARAAALATTVLEGVITRGTGASAGKYGVTGAVGGKTGTTNDYRDAWFVGFTPEYAIAVWVGRDQGANLGLTGGLAALPTWARFVASIQGSSSFAAPDGLEWVDVCSESGRVARPACPTTYRELIPAGKDESTRCDVHGGPVVEAGRALRKLFGGRGGEDPPERP